jgi:hypothetical protein
MLCRERFLFVRDDKSALLRKHILLFLINTLGTIFFKTIRKCAKIFNKVLRLIDPCLCALLNPNFEYLDVVQLLFLIHAANFYDCGNTLML